MTKANILNLDIQDINNLLEYVKEVANAKAMSKNIPWVNSMYFVGATLCLDMNSNEFKDTMTFTHSDETVGFFSGGLRVLLSIKSCRLLEEIMVLSSINHKTKWIKE